ncbi:hypothetical protein [Treponema berlinense]|uniref:hypothetical protein n=1 Tax=Treponema berlinense TaxID=225004 RepID=UPI0026EFB493|nr:hypothetical protein [Treponema berlinense]
MKRKISIIILLIFVSLIFAQSTTKVYVTASGKKYHTAYCRTISKSKNIKSMDKEAAKRAGYTACKVCNP